MFPLRFISLCLLFGLIGCEQTPPTVQPAPASDIKTDEQLVFFPAWAAPVDNGAAWELEIHGWVFEPQWEITEAYRQLRAALGIEREAADAGDRAVFQERAKLFLVDNERNKRVVVRLGEQTYSLDLSGPNGHCFGKLRLSAAEARQMRNPAATAPAAGQATRFHAVLPRGDTRLFAGELHWIDAEGWGVISDIDDTIKISEVRDKKALLANTFLRPFRAAPGMADLYQTWARRPGVSFHYVSASPWQLYGPLEEFRRQAGFPAGTFHLKSFRWKDESFFDLFASATAHKRPILEMILKRWPNRRFVLVGDSGESDPEIYGQLARDFPGRITRILIRNVTQEGADAPRYQQAFKDLPAGLWKIFREPAELGNDAP